MVEEFSRERLVGLDRSVRGVREEGEREQC